MQFYTAMSLILMFLHNNNFVIVIRSLLPISLQDKSTKITFSLLHYEKNYHPNW